MGIGSSVSTVTSKFQITLPELVRRTLPVGIGERIQWEVQPGCLVGRRLPTLSDLAGCLKSDDSAAKPADSGTAWARAAVARDRRTKGRK